MHESSMKTENQATGIFEHYGINIKDKNFNMLLQFILITKNICPIKKQLTSGSSLKLSHSSSFKAARLAVVLSSISLSLLSLGMPSAVTTHMEKFNHFTFLQNSTTNILMCKTPFYSLTIHLGSSSNQKYCV